MSKNNENIGWALFWGSIGLALLTSSTSAEEKDKKISKNNLEFYFPSEIDRIPISSLNRIFEIQKLTLFADLIKSSFLIGNSLVNSALNYPRTWFNPRKGKHEAYIWKADGQPEQGYLDCNGFLSRVCLKAGIDREFLFLGPHGFSASELYYYIGKKEEQLGDILVLTGKNKRYDTVSENLPGHVAIFCNQSEETPFIEMSNGIMFEHRYSEDYYLKNYFYSNLSYYRRKVTRNYFMNNLMIVNVIKKLNLSIQDKEDLWTAFKFNFPKFYFDDLEWDMNFYKRKGWWVQSKNRRV